jgi:hypothetical protein
MKRQFSMLVFAALVAVGACSRSNGRSADTTLNSDLSLAAQQRGYQPLDTLSPAERARANALNGAAAPVVPAPTHTTASAGEVSHTRRRRSGASTGAATTTTTTTSGGTVVKNTKRDAAIGAAAGAVLGATTSRRKVKGGLIGAAVGGLLGGVIGNNVDKHKKP